jgi:PAS domain S-box-containing protein
LSFNPICQDGRKTGVSVFGKDITERKQAEDTLREAEAKHRNIFEGAVEGMYRTTVQGRSLAANPALAKTLGYDSAEELISAITDTTQNLWIDPHERTRCVQLLEDQEVVRDFECQFRRKDGTAVWVSINLRKVCPDEQTAYYEGFIVDITERKRMQDALRKSAETFTVAFRSGPAMTLMFGPDEEGNRIIDVSEAFEYGTGYRREEVIGRTRKELGLWSDPCEADAYMNQLRANGRVRNFEYRFRRKNGDIASGLVSSEWIEIDGKRCSISSAIDITEQKKAEQARTTLVTAIEQTDETVVITDIDGTIQYCNPAFEKVTGYSKEEAIGQNPRVLKSGKHGKEIYEQLWATITQGKVWAGRLTNKKKDGSFYEEDGTISPIRDASEKISGFVAVKRDVTERLQLEDQLRQAQKLESIGRLAGGMAHDFNNLLTVINGYSGFLLRALKVGDPLRSYAEEITTAGERAASLTKQLLAFSRKQVIEPKALDLNAVIRESTVMLRRLIGDDIVLETHLDGSLGQVIADPDQIHQVIMNLAVNARDAMPDGGALDIETLNVELGLEDNTTSYPGRISGRYVLMTVTDTGHGMNETIQKEIFEPFFTTKGVGKGTGLGLSTVYGIIRQNGGWIDVWSEVGVGTTFKIYLPRIDACPEAERKVIIASSEGGGETILVVEDQKAVRSFAKTALRQHGYQVIEASDGDEALSVAKQHSGQIQLLVTDVVMPGLNGRELSIRLKELCPNLKVLFISGYTADVIANRGVLDPGVAFLHKPFGPEELAQKVREVLDASPLPSLEP